MTPETEEIIKQIRESLKDAGVSKVLLFGSRITGTEKADSDVDLVVVLEREEPCGSFSERSVALTDIRRRLSHISSRHGLDLLLFTRSEWERFVRKSSSFSKELQRDALNVA